MLKERTYLTMNLDSSSKFGGFSTASGKTVNVSKEALKKAKSLWEATEREDYSALEDDLEADEKTDEVQVDDIGDQNVIEKENVAESFSFGGGFSTASGKKVHVSEEALKQARSMWDDPKETEKDFNEDTLNANDDDDLSSEAPSKSEDFSAAGGKGESVPEQLEVRSLQENDTAGLCTPPVTNGFATASGKSVRVSDEALKRAKSLWAEELKDENEVAKGLSFEEDFDAPLKSSTPKPKAVESTSKERPKTKGFITPFRKTATTTGGCKSALTNNSNNFTPPVLNNKRVSHLKVNHAGPTKTLGTRPGKFIPPVRNPIVRTVESLKRARGSMEELVTHNKSPKLNSNLSSPTLLDGTNSVSESTLHTPTRITATESQEILYSSKALLEDDDDFGMTEIDETKVTDSGSRPLSFDTIIPDKKPISHLRAWVARVYPIVFMCKTGEGKTEYHSELSYEKTLSTKESRESKEMEKLFSQVEEEFRKARAASSPKVPLRSLNKDNLNKMTIADLLKIVESGDDFSNIYTLLSDSKLAHLREAQERKREEDRREIKKEVELRLKKVCCGFMTVTPVLRVKLIDISESSCTVTSIASRSAVLSFWRPCEDLRTSLIECLAVDIFSVSPSQSFDDIKLNSTRETRIQPCKFNEVSREKLKPLLRRCYSVDEILMEEFSPPFREFDVVGLIVQIDDPTCQAGETVFLSDGDDSIISVKFWRPLVDEGLEHIIKVGNWVAAANVQWRQSSSSGAVRTGYCQETTLFSVNPKEPYLKEPLGLMIKAVQDTESCISKCRRKIQLILNGEVMETPKTPPLVRRIRPHIFEPNRKKLADDFH